MTKRARSWAQKRVDAMSDDQVRAELRRLQGMGIVPPDRRSPLDRLIDEVCGVPAPSVRKRKGTR